MTANSLLRKTGNSENDVFGNPWLGRNVAGTGQRGPSTIAGGRHPRAAGSRGGTGRRNWRFDLGMLHIGGQQQRGRCALFGSRDRYAARWDVS